MKKCLKSFGLILWMYPVLLVMACNIGDKEPEEAIPDAAAAVEEAVSDIPVNPLKDAYFWETHLHTSASPDAFAFGTRNDANDAYRYAKGEPIKNAQTGQMIQKRTPYD